MSHLYFIFSIMFKSTLLYSVSQNTLRSWWQQPLGEPWDIQCQNWAVTHLKENQESYTTCTLSTTCQIDVVKINLFHHVIEITCFQKHIDDLLKCRGKKKLPYKEELRMHSFNILFLYTFLVVLPNRHLFKEIFSENLSIFLRKV